VAEESKENVPDHAAAVHHRGNQGVPVIVLGKKRDKTGAATTKNREMGDST